MPTEKLLIFDELGNAKRVKARLTRFLENEPVTNSEKSNIRTTLGIDDSLTGTFTTDVNINSEKSLIFGGGYNRIDFVDNIGAYALQIGQGSGDPYIRFNSANGAEQIEFYKTVSCSTNIKLGSGNGLDFSQTADASGVTGELFNDYETGTFDPSVSFGGASAGVTYSSREGYYTKVGNVVSISGRFTLSSKGTSNGTFNIDGLPFAVVNTPGSLFSACVGYTLNWDSSITKTPSLVVRSNTSQIFATEALTGNQLTDTALASNTDVRFSATYRTV